MKNRQRKTVVVAGASGFVGRALPDAFDSEDVRLVGLTRRPEVVGSLEVGEKYDEWRRCDLFSRTQTVDALEGADVGLYLVHSTLPSAYLTQGDPADMDLICADNFARAALHHDLERIIYVGVMAPADPQRRRESSHREVASVLGSYDTPLTTLWASMVIGRGGVVARTLEDLVRRLPVMVLPRWTESKTAPVDRQDLAELMAGLVEQSRGQGKSYELSGPEVTTYRDLLERTARLLGKNRTFASVPVNMPRLSVRWVAAFCGVHPAMVAEFVSQLTVSRFADPTGQDPLPDELWQPRPLEQTLRDALGVGTAHEESSAIVAVEPFPDQIRETEMLRSHHDDDQRRVVRSVQRLPLPTGRDARWVAVEYARWLPRFMRPFIRVERNQDQSLRLFVGPLPWPLLILEFDPDASMPERRLYWIRGGLLARRFRWARLEFRVVLDGSAVIAAIHDFKPRLPWPLYRWTQAKIHRLVMDRFGHHLQTVERQQQQRLP